MKEGSIKSFEELRDTGIDPEIESIFQEANRIGEGYNSAYILHKNNFKEVSLEELSNYDIGVNSQGKPIVVTQYPNYQISS